MTRMKFQLCLCAALGLVNLAAFAAPAVQVTLKLDAGRIAVKETTTLHVFAQIVEAQRASTERIFSWYVDLLDSDGTVARIDPANLVRPASDKDPRTSSSGTADGTNQRGIYDTFLNLAGAGRTAPVELFSIPVQGLAPGKTTFHIQAGTTVSGLAADFIVAPSTGGDPLLGGDYSGASIELDVTAGSSCDFFPKFTGISHNLQPGGLHQVTLTYPAPPCPGQNIVVEFRDDLSTGAWQSLPGAPHNSGSVTDPSPARQRFYRINVTQ